MPIKDIFSTFAEDTTILGVPRIAKASNKPARYLWVLFCTTALVVMIVQIVIVMQKYFSYPKSVSVEMSGDPAEFPAITVCHMRNMDPFTLNTLNEMFKSDKHPVNHLNKSNVPFINEYMAMQARYMHIFENETMRELYPALYKELSSRRSMADNIIPNILTLNNITLMNEFMVKCQLGPDRCEKHRLFAHSDAYYLHCLSYNLYKVEPIMNASIEGIENGYSAIFYSGNGAVQSNKEAKSIPGLHQHDSKSADSEGLRVIIHPPYTYPMPSMEGYDVPSGMSASFGISPMRFSRLNKPYGLCTDDFSAFNYTHKAFWHYRTSNCYSLVLQELINDECQCRDTSLLPSRLPQYQNLITCRSTLDFPEECMFNITEKCMEEVNKAAERISCMHRMKDKIANDRSILEQKQCFSPCNELTYDVSYSLSKWPASNLEGDATFIDIFEEHKFAERFSGPKKREMVNYFTSHELGNRTREDILRDFTRINVYVEQSYVYTSKEEASYEFPQMFSDLGGTMSMWLGISVITAVELLHLATDLSHYFIRDTHQKKKRKRQGKKNNNANSHKTDGEPEGNLLTDDNERNTTV